MDEKRFNEIVTRAKTGKDCDVSIVQFLISAIVELRKELAFYTEHANNKPQDWKNNENQRISSM